jgi:hypothetical protein
MSKSLLPLLLLGLTACTFDPAERIHADCMQRLEQQLADTETRALAQDNAAARMIAQTMVETARSAGTLACDEMRNACKTAPDGPICRAAKKSFE